MLNDLLVSEVRVKILRLFFSAEADDFYHVREITRRVGTEINAVRRELLRLTKAGVLKKEPPGNRLYYRVRELNPFNSDLYAWVNKDGGLAKLFLDNLNSLGLVKLIIVSKTFLWGLAPTVADVDLLLVGKINQEVSARLVKKEEERLGREINYAILTEEEFEFRKKRKDPFVVNILLKPRLLVFGDEKKYCQIKM